MRFSVNGPILDFCVLALVNKEDQYGYSITQSMQSRVDISESTLYPVLRRLKKDGLLDTYDEPYDGRNRRYYTITDKGRQELDEYVMDWSDFIEIIDDITQDREDRNE